jgi:hypothetical protein
VKPRRDGTAGSLKLLKCHLWMCWICRSSRACRNVILKSLGRAEVAGCCRRMKYGKTPKMYGKNYQTRKWPPHMFKLTGLQTKLSKQKAITNFCFSKRDGIMDYANYFLPSAHRGILFLYAFMPSAHVCSRSANENARVIVCRIRMLSLTSDLLSDGVAELSRVKTTVKSLKK